MVTGDDELFEIRGGELNFISDGKTNRCIGKLTCREHEIDWILAALNACRSLTTSELNDSFYRVGWLSGKSRVRHMTIAEERDNLRTRCQTLGEERNRLMEDLRISQLVVRERDARISELAQEYRELDKDWWGVFNSERSQCRALERKIHVFEKFVGDTVWELTHQKETPPKRGNRESRPGEMTTAMDRRSV